LGIKQYEFVNRLYFMAAFAKKLNSQVIFVCVAECFGGNNQVKVKI
jgi:hypothetical protein